MTVMFNDNQGVNDILYGDDSDEDDDGDEYDEGDNGYDDDDDSDDGSNQGVNHILYGQTSLSLFSIRQQNNCASLCKRFER